MAKPQVGTRVEEELNEQINEYVEEKGITKAEAMRILLRDGLEHDNTQELRELQEELRDEISEVRGAIITDGGQPLTEEMTALKSELRDVKTKQEQTDQYLIVAVILAVLLYSVSIVALSSLLPLVSLVLFPIGAVLAYIVKRTRGGDG
jgi:Flp pilus assembly protein TadB